jgi:hypothetical protein
MKNFLITTSIVIASTTGGVLLDNAVLDNGLTQVVLPDETTTEIELSMEIKGGHLLIHSGIHTYDLGEPETLSGWSETYDSSDDEKLRLIKQIVKEELKTKTPNELIESL